MNDEWLFSPAVIAKAQKYLADPDRVTRDPDVSGLFWVIGSRTSRYRVQTDADPEKGTASWITCTCRHGLNAGGGAARCSHAVAVLLATRDRMVLPSK